MTLTYGDFKGEIPTDEQILERAKEEKSYYDWPTYDSVINSLGMEILVAEDTGNYQGDLFYILKYEDRYGFLAISYGSCTVCDWLQGELRYIEIETDTDWPNSVYVLPSSFYQDVANMVGWGTREEVVNYVLNERDWEVFWGNHEPFLEAVRRMGEGDE